MGFPKGIGKLTSTGGTVTITNPNGPTTNLEVASSAEGITALTGDVTAAGPGSAAATLVATANVNAIAVAATLLGKTIYAGGAYTVAVSSTVITVLDSTNLIVTFTAPPSGAVDVDLEGFLQQNNAASARNIITWGLQNTAGTTSYGPLKRILDTNGGVGAAVDQRFHITIHVTGLTSGTSYTFAWAAGNDQVAGTQSATMNGDAGSSISTGIGPFEMRVRSA